MHGKENWHMTIHTEMIQIDCRTEPVNGGLRIHPEGEHTLVAKPQFYTAPLQVECSLFIQGDSRGLRILFAAGQVIFGEGDDNTLCWVDPRNGDYHRVKGMGALPGGEVTIRFELEPTLARVTVNGEERLTMAGTYTKGLAGQVGIGVPPAAAVTLRSLTVTAEEATLGHKVQKPGPVEFDGGLIDVLYDQHHQVLAWYVEHMGFKSNTWPGPADRNADATLFSTLSLPDYGAFHLYSVLTRKRLAHWYSERGTVDGHVRFTFQCPNLARTHAYFQEKGVRTSEISLGPGGREFFDFYAPEGTLLTAVSYPEKAEKYPDARFTNFAPSRVGVTDLSRSVQWYRDLLGINVAEDDSANGYVHFDNFMCLEAVEPEAHLGKVDGAARPYLVCHSRQQFTAMRDRLVQLGANPSEFMNPPGGRWSAFHFYDPDGNRLNVWSYY